jgi:hypothetical protein
MKEIERFKKDKELLEKVDMILFDIVARQYGEQLH